MSQAETTQNRRSERKETNECKNVRKEITGDEEEHLSLDFAK